MRNRERETYEKQKCSEDGTEFKVKILTVGIKMYNKSKKYK